MSYYPTQQPYYYAAPPAPYADAPTPGVPIGLPAGVPPQPPQVPYGSHPTSTSYGVPPGFQAPFSHDYHYPPGPPSASYYPPPGGFHHSSSHHSSHSAYHHDPHHQSHYPAPNHSTHPHHSGGLPEPIWYLGTPIPNIFIESAPLVVPGYDPTADVERIKWAAKGLGTDDQMLISVFAPLSAMKLEVLSRKFLATHGKILDSLVNSETSSWFRKALHALVVGPLIFDAELLHEALAGIGTNESILTELILGRPSSEIRLLKQAYRYRYGRDLVQEVSGDLSAKTQRMFVMALNSDRPPDTVPVDHIRVGQDVQALYAAGEGRRGTDQMVFCDILINRSQPHLTALIDEYRNKHKKPLTKVIKSEFTGHMERGLLHIVRGAQSKHDRQGIWRDAKLIHDSMSGLGTQDNKLVYRVVRAHWDSTRMESIKAAYFQKKGKTLEYAIRKDTSGSYRDLMVALVKSASAVAMGGAAGAAHYR